MTVENLKINFLKLQQEIIEAVNDELLLPNDPRLEPVAEGETISLRIGDDDRDLTSLRVFKLDGHSSDCWLLISRGRFVNAYPSSESLIASMKSFLP